MKIRKLKLENFRGFKDETVIDFEDFTVFVGKNDVGKSTILEALDIFFNKGGGREALRDGDINHKVRDKKNATVKITVVFDDWPDSLIWDDVNPTSLKDEYLLNSEGMLEIVKVYSGRKEKDIYLRAVHPANESCKNLILKNQQQLRTMIDNLKIPDVDKNKNAEMRRAILEYYDKKEGLKFKEQEILISGDKWERLKALMPMYALFKADRENQEQDPEIQDPLKLAVKQLVQRGNHKEKFEEISKLILEELKKVASRTMEKFRQINPEAAAISLTPTIPSVESLKWEDVFIKSVSIDSEKDIRLNNRGSGVRRQILMSFFLAEVEQKKQEVAVRGEQEDSKPKPRTIVYAIEEPEISLHPHWQRTLIESFQKMVSSGVVQVFLTTHSPSIVKFLDSVDEGDARGKKSMDEIFSKLRHVKKSNGVVRVDKFDVHQLPYVSLNEVNCLVFDVASEEYHNELYGYLETEDIVVEMKKSGCPRPEGWFQSQGPIKEYYNCQKGKWEKLSLPKYIRNQIHHPENKKNPRFTPEELKQSIELMKRYIKEVLKSAKQSGNEGCQR